MSMQGVKNEEKIELNKEEQARVRERSLKLLGEIIKPVKNRLFVSLALVITSQALRVSGPWLIAATVDYALPAAQKGDLSLLYWTVGGYVTTAVLAGFTIAYFLRLPKQVSSITYLMDWIPRLGKKVFLFPVGRDSVLL